MSGTRAELFGTDGIRGRANVWPMTPEVILEVGRALATVFRLGPGGDRAHRVLIGKDTRLSGYMLEDALASGLCSMGVEVLQVGPIPTPGLAFLTSDMRCEAAAMISASHNPFEDNGVKFFSSDGFKLPDDLEEQIESLVFSEELARFRPGGSQIGRARRIDDALGRYIVFLKRTCPGLGLEGLRIVVDCANGASYKVAPTVLEELGAEVISIGTEPNGTNINDGYGALHPQTVGRAVRRYRADLGIALDGDADRVVFADESGEAVHGDSVLAMCALEMHRAGQLRHDTVATTVMSNLALEHALAREGVKLVRTDVGDRYVVEAMRRADLNFGGEQSGHVVFLDHNTTGDGMLTALQVLAILRRRARPLSELAGIVDPLPQVLRSVRVREKLPLANLPELGALVQRIESDLGTRGRLLVRYSGTESVARVMLEGEEPARIEAFAAEVCELIGRLIGVNNS
jgi:phosphoglucosamine mutase